MVVRTFDTAKQPIGGEIRVDYAFQENSRDDLVRVAINNNGDFAVVWRRLDNHTLLSSVFLETFDPNGNPIALNQVGDSPGLYSIYEPDVAIDQSGNVTVSYVEDYTQGQEAVELETFNAAGLQTQISQIDNSPGFTYHDTKLAMSPDGSFYLGYTWTGPGWNPWWVLNLSRFTAGGTSEVFHLLIDYQQEEQFDFALSANASDQVEVAEVAQNVTDGTSQLRISQIDAGGVSPGWTVIDNSGNALSNPAVALADDGACVVAYNTTSVIGTSGSRGTDIVELDTTGSDVSNQTLLDGSGREVSDPALSIDGNGNYVATFTAPAWDHEFVAGEIWERGGVL